MNVIWVAEDIKKDGSFKQTKAEVLCTLSCLLFVKKYLPTAKTIFFVDDFTKNYYEQFGFLSLFDTVDSTLLNQIDSSIDRKTFWAAGKIYAQRNTPGPTLTFDLDFRFFSDLSKLGIFDEDIACLWLEEIGNEFYHQPSEALKFTELNWKHDWDKYALNVSMLFLKNDEFKNLYCDKAIEYMKSCSNKIPSSNIQSEQNKFILFAEQYMLFQLAKEKNQQVKLLIDNFYPLPPQNNFVKSSGIDMNNCGYHFYHFGHYKNNMIAKDELFYEEIKVSHFVVNKNIEVKNQIDIFNKIYNISEHEGCFR